MYFVVVSSLLSSYDWFRFCLLDGSELAGETFGASEPTNQHTRDHVDPILVAQRAGVKDSVFEFDQLISRCKATGFTNCQL